MAVSQHDHSCGSGHWHMTNEDEPCAPAHESELCFLPWLQNGVHYWFTDKETMQAEIEDGQFLEFAHVHDNIYGTSIRAVRDVAAQGKCCILDIDVQGARQVLKNASCKASHNAWHVTPLPPSKTLYG